MTEWYALKGYEGLYEITKDGRICSTPRELHPTKDAQGYMVIQLKDYYGNKKLAPIRYEPSGLQNKPTHHDALKHQSDQTQ